MSSPIGLEKAMFGMGCFWGVEHKIRKLNGVVNTTVGYAGGHILNPTYEEVCKGNTGHNEVVFLQFNPEIISYQILLQNFWEGHDPTQGMRQGNDRGTQYRSGIYTFSKEHHTKALASKVVFQSELSRMGFSSITTEISTAPDFFPAEEYHQEYLIKNSNGYCGLGGIGVDYPIGLE